jgi:hypothetical protein
LVDLVEEDIGIRQKVKGLKAGRLGSEEGSNGLDARC